MALSVPITAAAQPDDDGKPKPLPTPSAAQLSAPAPDLNAPGPRVKPSPGTEAAYEAISKRIGAYAARHGHKYTFGTYIDPDTGKILIESDAPEGDVPGLINLPGARSADERQAASEVVVHRTRITASYGRHDDEPPFFGGGAITNGSGACSAGYPVRNSAGTRFMVTAGHCFPDGHFVFTESGRHLYGNVTGRRLNGSDMELVGPQYNYGAVFTGSPTSVTAKPIVNYGNAAVGHNNYCFSGRTSGEVCGLTRPAPPRRSARSSVAATTSSLLRGPTSGHTVTPALRSTPTR
ncbi:MAG: hypothetical protein ACRDRG_00750 [Pseudonocardiaceae bacterium]